MKVHCRDCISEKEGYCQIDNHLIQTENEECIFGVNRQKSFIKGLKDLLIEHHATLSTDDHFEGYPECGMDVRMTVEFDWLSNTGYEGFANDIDLGGYVNGE